MRQVGDKGMYINSVTIGCEFSGIRNKIDILRIGDTDSISLTDLAKYFNPENPDNVIITDEQ